MNIAFALNLSNKEFPFFCCFQDGWKKVREIRNAASRSPLRIQEWRRTFSVREPRAPRPVREGPEPEMPAGPAVRKAPARRKPVEPELCSGTREGPRPGPYRWRFLRPELSARQQASSKVPEPAPVPVEPGRILPEFREPERNGPDDWFREGPEEPSGPER